MTAPRLGHFIDVEGRVAHLHVIGQGGTPVLLLHGCGSLAEEILPPFEPLARRGYLLIAPDRPGYGYSEPLPDGREGADRQAAWLAGLLDRLRLETVIVAAHSLGAGPALCLEATAPERVAGLVLLAGFCRPTPHAALPMLRAAVAPLVGPFIRKSVIPAVAPALGPRLLAAALKPHAVPDYFAGFPYLHAGRSRAVLTMAAELRAFNDCLEAAAPGLAGRSVAAEILHGSLDGVADPDWHLPWVAGLLPRADVRVYPDVGHALHHGRPHEARAAVDRLAARLRARSRRLGRDRPACPPSFGVARSGALRTVSPHGRRPTGPDRQKSEAGEWNERTAASSSVDPDSVGTADRPPETRYGV
ncbi:alpha/beta fold hydrolase [Prosthecomicrobium sp. N25]|uniref:alpha/beta fold hydrolase n=1 Tax=Prosthecomicrobium sp. N25 TaxID=3129254 RepID=UPI0030769D00